MCHKNFLQKNKKINVLVALMSPSGTKPVPFQTRQQIDVIQFDTWQARDRVKWEPDMFAEPWVHESL